MAGQVLVAGDFSGIQNYVLNVSTAGGGQARRLRARSFYVQAATEVVAWRVLQAFGQDWRGLLTSGGGQFLVRAPDGAEAETKLTELRAPLEARLYSETQGELGLNLACGGSLEEALARKQQQKRRPWASALTVGDGWRLEMMSLEGLGDRCQICEHQAGTTRRPDDEESAWVCSRCDTDTEVGKRLTRIEAVFLDAAESDLSVLGCNVALGSDALAPMDGVRVPRSFRRHVPADDAVPRTFEKIAECAKGDNLLAVLKADADNMGMQVSAIAQQDPSLERLKQFSADLDRFFSEEVQKQLQKPEWESIYTVYSGGDDLLLIGPWNKVLDFASVVREGFAQGPGRAYKNLTLSAGIALTPFRVPVRHAVGRADWLLENHAKVGLKDRCATTLGAAWDWSRHDAIILEGKRIAGWIGGEVAGRALIHRLLSIAASSDPKKSALWAYQIGRNFPSANDRSAEEQAFRKWGIEVLEHSLDGDRGALDKVQAALRYALIATRARRD
jgi:CRISPR-associated protein Csm1